MTTRPTLESARFLFRALAAWDDEDRDIEAARAAATARLDEYDAHREAGGPEPMVTAGGYVDWPGDRMAADLRARIARNAAGNL